MSRFIAVDRQTVEKGHRVVAQAGDREPDVRNQDNEERQRMEAFVAAERRRRDDEHRRRTAP